MEEGDALGNIMVPSSSPIPAETFLVRDGAQTGEDNEAEDIIDRFIVHKGKGKGRGGWALARLTHLMGCVTEHKEQKLTITYGVEFCSEGNQVQSLVLLPDKQTKQSKGEMLDVGSWWPLTVVSDEASASQ